MTTIHAAQATASTAVDTLDETTNELEPGSGATLPDPLTTLAMSADPGAELAALAVQSGERQETIAQTACDAEEQMEVTQDNQQVSAMHQKADDIRAAGAWAGIGMMVEGGGSVAAAFAGEKVRLGFQGGGKMANGAASITGSMFAGREADEDAAAAAAKSASDEAKGAADDLNDARKTGGDLISAALEFYREYTSAQASAKSAALHRA